MAPRIDEGRTHPRRRRDLSGEWARQAERPAPPVGAPMRPDLAGEPPPEGYDIEHRNFFDRIGDEVRSWFGDYEAERRREYDELMHRPYGDPRILDNRIGFSSLGDYYGAEPYRTFTYPQSGFASSRPPQDFVRHDRHYDLEYQAWRESQIAALDRDYREFRQENQKRFEAEFAGWRQRRCQQRDCLALVREHMEVVGSDGAHVGTVDYVEGDRIILTKGDPVAGGMHHSIPSRWIGSVADKVVLERTADEAQHEWRSEQNRQAFFHPGAPAGVPTGERPAGPGRRRPPKP